MKTLSTIQNVQIGIRSLLSLGTAAVFLAGIVRPRHTLAIMATSSDVMVSSVYESIVETKARSAHEAGRRGEHVENS